VDGLFTYSGSDPASLEEQRPVVGPGLQVLNRGHHPFRQSGTFGLGKSARQTLAASRGLVSRLPSAVFRLLAGIEFRLGER
jgi:hypothetical protein